MPGTETAPMQSFIYQAFIWFSGVGKISILFFYCCKMHCPIVKELKVATQLKHVYVEGDDEQKILEDVKRRVVYKREWINYEYEVVYLGLLLAPFPAAWSRKIQGTKTLFDTRG